MLTLIKRRSVVREAPRIRDGYLRCAIEDGRGEVATLKKRPVKLEIEHEVEASINVCTTV